jgi:hypothetical protein
MHSGNNKSRTNNQETRGERRDNARGGRAKGNSKQPYAPKDRRETWNQDEKNGGRKKIGGRRGNS